MLFIYSRIPVTFKTTLNFDAKWYSNEKQITSNDKYVIVNTNESTTLNIKSVEVTDQQEYKVVINNEKETYTYKTFLHVTSMIIIRKFDYFHRI